MAVYFELLTVGFCLSFLVIVFLIWLYSYLTCGVCNSKATMNGKTVIVTGGNSGIGKLTALDLAQRGARVIMACRNIEKANEVKDYIIKTTKNSNIEVRRIDLSDLSSVRRFAEDIKQSEARLDVLIHNAANLVVSGATQDGLNPIWASNYYGPFLLTHLLIDLLKKTKNSRIVVVTSSLHWFGRVSLQNPNPVDAVSQWKLYRDTKFANVLFSNELARRLKDTGVTANCLHPGLIFTPLWNDVASYWMYLMWFLKPFLKIVNIRERAMFLPVIKHLDLTEEQGAQTTIYLAVSEKVEGVTGKYFEDCRVWLSNFKAKDKQLGQRFWEISEKLVRLKESDPHI